MNFVYPAFLWASLAIAIPIAIHLFNFRRYKTVYFSSLRFLKQVETETKKSRRLKHLLVLAARCLAILALVFAFAKPVIPNKGSSFKQGEKAVSVYIDNSFSMQALGTDGSLLDKAKQTAQELVKQYSPADKFQLLTNDFEGKHQHLLNREEFLDQLKEVDYSSAFRRESEVYARQRDFLNNQQGNNKQAFQIGDFQKTTLDFANLKPDTAIATSLVLLQSNPVNNLYIDSIWFATPYRKLNQPEELTVRVVNGGSAPADNIPLKLYINSVQKAPTTVSVQPNQKTEVKLTYSIQQGGFQFGELQLTDAPVTYDDKFYFSYNIQNQLPILAINGNNPGGYLNSLFGNDPFTKLTTITEGQIDYSLFTKNNLIILNGLQSISSGLNTELKKFVDGGGSVLIFPALSIDAASYKLALQNLKTSWYEGLDTVKLKVNTFAAQDPIYNDIFDKAPNNIDLPVAYKHYKLSQALSAEEPLMKLPNGQSFLARYKSGKGTVYLCASPLDGVSSNFPKHALFVPTLYKIALFSEAMYKPYYTAGVNNTLDIGNATVSGDNTFKIVKTDKSIEFIPTYRNTGYGTSVDVGPQLDKAGNYYLVSGNDTIAPLSLNYSPLEGNLAAANVTELETALNENNLSSFNIINLAKTNITNAFTKIAEGFQLWRYFILAALLFLLAEVLLLRFMK